MRRALILLLLASGAGAEDRLGVFELFVRGGGTYCRLAAPSVSTLQAEMAGRAVLLEYAYDSFSSGRVDRWWAAYHGPSSVYLPLVMVGSGLDVSQGPVDYYNRYKAMLNAELARPPAASVRVWSRRVGDGLQVYVRATNLSDAPLTPDQAAAFWVIVWEDNPIGLTQTWVRATATRPLAGPLQPGDTTSATIDVASLSNVDWQHLRALALIEHRPTGGGAYDMLQAAIASPAVLDVTPSGIVLGPSTPSAEISIDGPDVLSWTATPEVTWLQIVPASGAMPATCVVSLVGTPAAGQHGTVRIDATGSGMSCSTTVTVTTQGQVMRARRHLQRAPASPAPR
ncbi:MAG: hypothetical protein MUF10_00650 [Thermoanaerobaculaceae bacterium]|nr:hypothetical protein [Thermoanaerobaculaceae bacterium]